MTRLSLRAISLAAVTSLALLLLTQPALAAQDVELGKRHGAAAKTAFEVGKFSEAAKEYERAYRAHARPAFLFNLAQCYMRMKTAPNLRLAVHNFRAFLRAMPSAPNAAAVRAKIAEVEAKASRLEAAAAAAAANGKKRPQEPLVLAPLPPKPAPQLHRPFYKKWWFWTLVGVVAAGGGVAIGVAASSVDSRVPGGPSIALSSFNLGVR